MYSALDCIAQVPGVQSAIMKKRKELLHSEALYVRVTKSEKLAMRQAARKAGLGEGAWVRQAIAAAVRSQEARP
jgi:hypothetical protein